MSPTVVSDDNNAAVTSNSTDGAGNGSAGVDTTPLLGTEPDSRRTRSRGVSGSLQGAARFLRRASSRRIMRESSMRVREAAAEQIEERQSDWAYSKPVVILDVLWNFAFVMISVGVLIMSRRERPLTPLRLWIIGYALQCAVHVGCVCIGYEERGQNRNYSSGNLRSRRSSWDLSGSDGSESGDRVDEGQTSVITHLQSANTMFSFVWWIVGFYWVSADSQSLMENSPRLYWLCVIFLAFDVFFVVLCLAAACVIGIAVCLCLPCIIGILYAVADQQGASKEDVERLLKYKFRRIDDFEKENGEIQESSGGIMTQCDAATPMEHVLSHEDAECCICICGYEDGTELRELPCRHHFHCGCIDKWLYINPTCPLCKFNILKNGGSEEV